MNKFALNAIAAMMVAALSGCDSDNHKNTSETPKPEASVPGGELPEIGVSPDELPEETPEGSQPDGDLPEIGVPGESAGPNGAAPGGTQPEIGVEDAAEYNIHVAYSSTYPRSVVTGWISSRSEDKNDIFDLYYSGGKPEQISHNVFVKGEIPFVNEEKSVDDNIQKSGDEPGVDPENPGPGKQELEIISEKVLEVPEEYKVNVFIEDTMMRFSTASMTPEALARTKSITIFLEGAGSIMPNNDRMSKTLAFAQEAANHGVENFYLQIFSSMDLEILAEIHPLWKELIESPLVTLVPVDFDELGHEINKEDEAKVLNGLINNYGYDLSTAFTASPQFDPSKELLVFFGSSRNSESNTERGRKGGDFNNMMLIESYLSNPEITEKYNIAVKPHPKLADINTYIVENGLDASYFSSMPYEMIALAAGKDIGGVYLPEIHRFDSTYSTILFGVPVEKINAIIDYSPHSGHQSGASFEYMKDNYNLQPGWGVGHYEAYAADLIQQLGAPHIKNTNVYNFVNGIE